MFKRFVVAIPLMLLVAASALVMSSPAHAALGLHETPDSTYMTNGNVYATAVSENREILYIGGKFKQVREKPTGQSGKVVNVNNVAAIDMDTGAPISSWKPAVTSDAGALEVRSLAVKGGQVYIGGKFTAVEGQPRRNLAAVDATTGAVSAFNPTVGDDTSVVYSILPGSSKLYIGGKFSRVGGTGRGNLAALNPTSGALDPDWKPRTKGLVRDLEFDSTDATVFAVGAFGGEQAVSYGGAYFNRQSVVRLDAATGNVHPWAPAPGAIQTDSGRGNTMTCWSATVTSTRLFLTCGLGPNYAVALRLDAGDTGSQVWQVGFVGNPVSSALSPDGSRLIVGGHFGINPLDQQVCGDRYLKGLVALNPTNGAIDCSWIPSLDQKSRPDYDGAWTIQTIGDYVWVSGGFKGVSGTPQSNLARFTYDPTLKSVNAAPIVDLDGSQQPSSGPQRGGLDAAYFSNLGLTGAPALTRTDPTVNFDWGNGSPDPDIGADGFSARWTGQVEAPVGGEYTFTTTSDDGVRLSVDGQQIVDNWTNHGPTDDSGTVTLEAGRRYDIQLDYYEDGGGAVARLQWSYPGQTRQVIPASSLFYSAPTTGGLDATYFDNVNFTGPQVTRIDPRVNFDWGDGSPDPAIDVDTFSARWTGQVEAPVSGEYTFTTTADDGVRLFVDNADRNKLVIDNWSDRAPTDDSGTVTLEAGRRYDIQLDYYENGGGAVARLQWSYPGQTRQVIPASSLFPAGTPDYSATFSAGAGPAPIVGTGLTVNDADDANIRFAKVTLADRPDGNAEVLSANGTGTPIAVSYNAQTGVLSLDGSATKAAYQQVLRTVTYNNTSANPSGGDRQVSFVVNDGSVDSKTATATVSVQGP